MSEGSGERKFEYGVPGRMPRRVSKQGARLGGRYVPGGMSDSSGLCAAVRGTADRQDIRRSRTWSGIIGLCLCQMDGSRSLSN